MTLESYPWSNLGAEGNIDRPPCCLEEPFAVDNRKMYLNKWATAKHEANQTTKSSLKNQNNYSTQKHRPSTCLAVLPGAAIVVSQSFLF